MAQLNLANIIDISVSAAGAGLGDYNTSNLGLFTRDTPGGGFGSNGYKLYLSPDEVGTDFGTNSITFKMANAIFSQQPNILAGNGYLAVIPYLSLETLGDAIVRTKDLIQYFGILSSDIPGSVDTLAAAAIVQPLNKIMMVPSKTAVDVDSGGLLDELRTGGFSHSRGLLYLGTGVTNDTLVMAASYAGRAFSTNFSGSNTTSTMHLKDLIGVQPDSAMTQTILNKCKDAGADVYASFQGVAKVFCSGKNSFFDQVYNLEWFVGALQVAGFNFLAQSSTKIPQTENGMNGLKSAYRNVCEQAVSCAYSAPGSWNSATTFGNQADFLANIAQRGYYIFSSPIATQSQTDRAARKAPLIQIALKEAGAIHSSNVIVNINA